MENILLPRHLPSLYCMHARCKIHDYISISTKVKYDNDMIFVRFSDPQIISDSLPFWPQNLTQGFIKSISFYYGTFVYVQQTCGPIVKRLCRVVITFITLHDTVSWYFDGRLKSEYLKGKSVIAFATLHTVYPQNVLGHIHSDAIITEKRYRWPHSLLVFSFRVFWSDFTNLRNFLFEPNRWNSVKGILFLCI